MGARPEPDHSLALVRGRRPPPLMFVVGTERE